MPQNSDQAKQNLATKYEEPSPEGRTLYALTLRHNPKYKKVMRPAKVLYTSQEKDELYNSVFESLETLYTATFHEKRKEMKGGMHYHCCLYFDSVPYFKALKITDFHLQWNKIYDLVGWQNYIRKEVAKSNLFI